MQVLRQFIQHEQAQAIRVIVLDQMSYLSRIAH